MQASIPKQYLELMGQPIAAYSLQTFASMPEIGEIVVVCEDDYRYCPHYRPCRWGMQHTAFGGKFAYADSTEC